MLTLALQSSTTASTTVSTAVAFDTTGSLSIAVPLSVIALVISIAAYLMQRDERRASVRGSLHAEWIRGIRELGEGFGELRRTINAGRRARRLPADWEKARLQWAATFGLVQRNALFLPVEVTDAGHRFLDAVWEMMKKSRGSDRSVTTDEDKEWEDLNRLYLDWFTAAREAVGVETVQADLQRIGIFGDLVPPEITAETRSGA